MKDVPKIQLRDVSVFPDDAVLKKTLGRSFAWYAKLLHLFAANDMLHEWRYYRDGNAWLHGRDYVTPEDIQAIAPDVLRHRVLLSYEAEAEGRTPDQFIDALLARIPVP